jgi:hypothetical protein
VGEVYLHGFIYGEVDTIGLEDCDILLILYVLQSALRCVTLVEEDSEGCFGAMTHMLIPWRLGFGKRALGEPKLMLVIFTSGARDLGFLPIC